MVLSSVKEDYRVQVTANPFHLELQSKGETVLSMNSNGLLYFEHLQPPPSDRYSICLIAWYYVVICAVAEKKQFHRAAISVIEALKHWSLSSLFIPVSTMVKV